MERVPASPAPGARWRRALPYLLLGIAAAGLFALALQFEFPRRPGTLGPDAWPKGIALLLLLVCAGKAVEVLMHTPRSTPAERLADEDQETVTESHPVLLVLGMAATLAYVWLVPRVGFFVCTAAYLAAFLWIGGYRRRMRMAAMSLFGALLLMFVFMKLVYVSLPLGEPPFSGVMLTLMDWMGIR